MGARDLGRWIYCWTGVIQAYANGKPVPTVVTKEVYAYANGKPVPTVVTKEVDMDMTGPPGPLRETLSLSSACLLCSVFFPT